MLIRHPRHGQAYDLKERPAGTEDLDGGYLIPLDIKAGSKRGSIELVEQTPRKDTLRIGHHSTLEVLENALTATGFSTADLAKLRPIVALRAEVGTRESTIASLRKRKNILDGRIHQHRENLRRLKGMTGAKAESMRRERSKQLEAFTKKGDKLALEMERLEEQKQQYLMKLQEQLMDLNIPSK